MPIPSVSDPGLDELETHPVSLRPEVSRNDGSGSLADRGRFPEHARQNVRVQPSTVAPDVPLGGGVMQVIGRTGQVSPGRKERRTRPSDFSGVRHSRK